jgi:hypothetical protein
VEARVVWFVRECGLLELGWPEDNLLLTSDTYGEWGKGPAAYRKTPGVTVFIDNTADCLWSMEFDDYGNCSQTLEVQVTMQIRRPAPFAIPG